MTIFDPVEYPKHYNSHPSGVECVQITEHMNFCVGNAVKYLWRAEEKGNTVEDLMKARWYIDREIKRRELEAERTLAGEPKIPARVWGPTVVESWLGKASGTE